VYCKAQGAHNKTQNLCLGMIHIFLGKMEQAKGGQEEKEAYNNDGLLI
jgi:hypothetical protein